MQLSQFVILEGKEGGGGGGGGGRGEGGDDRDWSPTRCPACLARLRDFVRECFEKSAEGNSSSSRRRRRRRRAQAAPMHAGWLERTDQPSSSAFCQTLCWPLMELFKSATQRVTHCAPLSFLRFKRRQRRFPLTGALWNKVLFSSQTILRLGHAASRWRKQRIKDSRWKKEDVLPLRLVSHARQ
ncbi:Hypothetical predicted protein [Xyrichtys novacula]|uniref:Uncharacterized protein n=1 Tax=Xyrichtys novacula TaxID=13765 RepID=A0AAV1EIM9_XYRNO|nr:Hypothetical predicted protein [Xyrichtys novacula]